MSDANKEDDFQTDHLEAMAEETVDIMEENEEMDALIEERDMLKDRLLRALADIESVKPTRARVCLSMMNILLIESSLLLLIFQQG